MNKLVYVVICDCPILDIDGIKLSNGDEHYHIDSIWTSERKAKKRRDELNNDIDLLEDYGYGEFTVEQHFICK